jgi:hypothetical protein
MLITLGVFGALIVAAVLLTARGRRQADVSLGSMSTQWLAEQRAGHS